MQKAQEELSRLRFQGLSTLNSWKMQGMTGMPQHPVFEVGAVPALCNSVMPDMALSVAEGDRPAVLHVGEMQIEEIDDAILANRRRTYLRSVNPHEGERLRIVCDQPVRSPAAGQSAVLYSGEQLLGGGFICPG